MHYRILPNSSTGLARIMNPYEKEIGRDYTTGKQVNFFFLGGLISLFAALGLQSLYSKQKFHNLYKVSALVRMVLTQ